MTGICSNLEWDSNFFGYRIARINGRVLTPESVEQIAVWCNAERIECLYFLADADDTQTARLAEQHRLAFVDMRLTLTAEITAGSADKSIRACEPSDIPILKSIARISHRASRFYHDPVFSNNRCDTLFETWIERSCGDFANVTFVSSEGDEPTGYITCNILPDGRGQIGLLGVADAHRSKGIGRRLIAASFAWFRDQGVSQVEVVTQGRNIAAQRAYQKNGFLTVSVEHWYHWWSAKIFPRPSSDALW